MSDRRTFTPDRALAQQYESTMADIRTLSRRGAWPTPVQIDVAATPLASTPAPTYVVDSAIDAYDGYPVSVEVAELRVPQGRWYIVGESSQRFTRGGGIPIAYAGQFLLLDGVVVRSAKSWDGFYSEPTQMSHKSALTLNAPLSGVLVELRVFCLWSWIIDPDPAPTQSLRTARIIAYPG